MTEKHKHSSKARRPKQKKPKNRPSRPFSGAASGTGENTSKKPVSANPRQSSKPSKRDKRDSRGSGARSSGNKGDDWIYGTHASLAALANPARTCLRIVLSAAASDDLESEVDSAAHSVSGRPDVEFMNRDQISALLPPGAVHQGVALLASPLADVAIEDIASNAEEQASASVVVLDQATDPRNVGAVLRSAAAFGALAVVVQDRHTPPLTGALCKAASGAVEQVALVRVVNLARAITTLKNAGFWAAGLDAGAPRTLAQADLSGRVALVLGAEGPGLRRLTRDTCDELLKLPIAEGSDSLNLSNAAAVALYELNRGQT
ncbi:MAG: 23S rRNA (guanosine(2251)-2'-O)-methyltransferase RlmB [Alphaproteobacteria bacterium]|nr:23S rRNA (guanosine(2251)-2'-O)-methyltransferase RlmB [Alphaproteobacteria bacterium]MBT7943871.1 23S rRNA (guanosine(2251)-2'-O)-methyltransferase RlmB [Alphaproteobacteria bacterium]